MSSVQTAKLVSRLIRPFYIRSLTIVIASLILLVIIGPSMRGWWLRHQLLTALDNASSVVVVEDSDPRTLRSIVPGHVGLGFKLEQVH